jgi:hypothetical protein
MAETKVCTKCHIEKPATLEYFHHDNEGRNGLHPSCKSCESKKRKIYYENNHSKVRSYSKKYFDANKESENERSRIYHFQNRLEILERKRKYKIKHPDRVKTTRTKTYLKHKRERNHQSSELLKIRYKNNPQLRISMQIASGIRDCLNGRKNHMHWPELVGFTLSDLMNQLETHFQPGMSWDNYGEWHIDHHIPISAFNFNSYNDPEFRACWSLTNLRPLWAIDNIKKGNKIIDRKLRLF